MATRMNFEPYIDFEAMTPEQAVDLRDAIRAYRDSGDQLAEATEPETILSLAQVVLRASTHLQHTANAIMSDLHVTPVMVHIAGERKEETNPADPDEQGIVQRCQRCGSILNFWSEDVRVFDLTDGARSLDEEEIQWWREGEIVAKANTPIGSVGMYPIEPGRPLEKHEHECADLSELGA